MAFQTRELVPGAAISSNCKPYKIAFVLALPFVAWTLWSIDSGKFASFKKPPPEGTVESRVNDILASTPLIDGHNDLAYFIRWAHNNRLYLNNFTQPFEGGTLGGEVDIRRLRQGLSGGAFWSTFADCPTEDYSLEYYAKALSTTEAANDVIHRIHARYPDVFARPNNSSDAMAIFRSGRIISPLAVEGLHLIGDSYTKLRSYHASGVRLITLTHNCHNSYADSALVISNGKLGPSRPKWGGVSKAGQGLVHEMNRLGIIVDLSHTSADTMRAVLGAGNRDSKDSEQWEGTLAPPVFSHSSAFSLCPHPRNVPDDVLQLLKKRDGVAMVTFSPDFVSCEWPGGHKIEGHLPRRVDSNLTISQVVRHMRYIGDLIGYEHVGVGSDFDGVPFVIEGLEDVSKYPSLVAEMLRQGISDEVAGKIVGGNLLRVWGKVDEVAARMQATGVLPAEDGLSPLDNPWTEHP
ncbi:microsomal dipeptidase precursor [Massarina eburnea CBS 473.64]|uniref:Dipeptidase n=1 Tax=Massarina eburnea CBS 473.64 TaxID=1395130 RepID=A0A6A6SDL1_9PLEO|nr:microsomal dipeptidase precursor [Massarina eburnea CBS 473.64]